MSIRDRAAFCGLLLACVLGGLVARVAPVAAQQPAPRAPDFNPRLLAFVQAVDMADADSELTKKFKERHNTAVELLKAQIQEYKSGVRDLSAVLEAARLVVQSKLDLASDDPGRLAVYQDVLEVAKMIEDRLAALYESGIGPVSEYRRAQIARLNVEIEILKLKESMSAPAESAPVQP